MIGAVLSPLLAKRFLLAAAVAGSVGAALPVQVAGAGDSDAEKRAELFEAEARKILVHDLWKITREGKTSFTAVHAAASGGATSADNDNTRVPPLFVYVSVTFTPKSADGTDCAVKIEGFRFTPQPGGRKPQIHGPYKADYPENSNYVRKVLENAEDRLGQKYPKYQAK